MYTETATELLRELQRGTGFPLYNEDGVRQVLEEMNSIYNDVRVTLELPEEDRQSEAVAAGLVTQHAALMRNKRCVLAYLNFRLNYIKRLRWELGSGSLAQGYRELMSAEEISFFHSYSQLLTEMHDAYSNVPMDSSSQEETQWLDLDLCTDLTPPSALLVKVRVLTDGGEVATENGSIYLQAHSTQFLPRTDVETLVAQGIVKEVD